MAPVAGAGRAYRVRCHHDNQRCRGGRASQTDGRTYPQDGACYGSACDVNIRYSIGRRRIATLGPYEVELYSRERKRWPFGGQRQFGQGRMTPGLPADPTVERQQLPSPIGATELPSGSCMARVRSSPRGSALQPDPWPRELLLAAEGRTGGADGIVNLADAATRPGTESPRTGGGRPLTSTRSIFGPCPKRAQMKWPAVPLETASLDLDVGRGKDHAHVREPTRARAILVLRVHEVPGTRSHSVELTDRTGDIADGPIGTSESG